MQQVNLIQLTPNDLQLIFQQGLKHFFSTNNIKVNQLPSNEEVVDLVGLLKARPFIGSRSTVYKKASKGLIPHSKRGKKLYFNLSKIDEWLLAKEIKSPQEIQAESKKYLIKSRRGRRNKG